MNDTRHIQMISHVIINLPNLRDLALAFWMGPEDVRGDPSSPDNSRETFSLHKQLSRTPGLTSLKVSVSIDADVRSHAQYVPWVPLEMPQLSSLDITEKVAECQWPTLLNSFPVSPACTPDWLDPQSNSRVLAHQCRDNKRQ